MTLRDPGVEIRRHYQVVLSALSKQLLPMGFKARGGEAFTRVQGAVTQRLASTLREPEGEAVGFVEVYPGFNFPEVEEVSAHLRGTKPRRGFITCSLNIGLLTPKAQFLEWRLRSKESPENTAHKAVDAIADFAIPFWKEFLTIEELVKAFEGEDPRLCSGDEWPWQQAAAYSVMGKPRKAIHVLNKLLEVEPPSQRATIEAAIRGLTQTSRM
jgi:hypothetical protein